MLLYQKMKAHFNLRRLARDVATAMVCALLLSPSASAMSRIRLQVTVPEAEGHPRGDYSTYMASAPRTVAPMIVWQRVATSIMASRILNHVTRLQARPESNSASRARAK